MKCQACQCEVSSEFTYSIDSNCCPKCGNQLMVSEVKLLLDELRVPFEQNNNDLVELIKYLVANFNISKNKKETVRDQTIDELQVIENKTELEPHVGAIATNINEQVEETNIKLLEPQRVSLFAKRAGVDKIQMEKPNKFNSIVQHIQGKLSDEAISSNEENESVLYDDDSPLSRNEIHAMNDLFGSSSNQSPVGDLKFNLDERKKVDRIQQLSMMGSVGKIKRST